MSDLNSAIERLEPKYKVEELSSLFKFGGLSIIPLENPNIDLLNREDIILLFEHYGVILFRELDLEPNNILSFTDKFTLRYSNDKFNRQKRFNSDKLRSVDAGSEAHVLHSEASYSPSWPEIIWFYCNTPPSIGGETMFCDGIELWEILGTEAKTFFLRQPLKFELNIPTGIVKPNRGKQKWIIQTPGVVGEMNWETGNLHLTALRYAAHFSRHLEKISFANHVLVPLKKSEEAFKMDDQILNSDMVMADGQKVPNNFLEEIREKSESICYDHSWKKKDLFMIDNKRFMHGRRSFAKNMERDIIISQTRLANFGYGSTTRAYIP